MFTEMMVTNIYVFGTWAKLGEPGKFKSTRIVFKDFAIHVGMVQTTGMLRSLISLMRSMIGMTSLKAMDMAMYSASVVDKATWDWTLEAQMMGHPA